jgi:hypothetical protein
MVPVKLEKEARLVLNEILAKLNMNEKMIGGGAIVVVIGWILGLILTGSGAGVGYGSVSWYGSSGAQTMGLISVIAAIAAIVVIYLKYAPNMKITWPAPIEVVELSIAAVVGLVALYLLWTNFSNSSVVSVCNGFSGCPSWPMTDWIAVIGVVAGAAVMLLGAYQEWAVTKKAAV